MTEEDPFEFFEDTAWVPEFGDLKFYRHFDTKLNLEQAKVIADDGYSLQEHSFYPFIRYVKKWRRFVSEKQNKDHREHLRNCRGKRKKVSKKREKTRPISYACRKDSILYKKYRNVLSEKYENELLEYGLNECVLAYRSIPICAGAKTNKSNIEFSKEAFEAIDGLGKCVAVAMDISKYFDRISHAKLKARWMELLGVKKLPLDHFRIFKNMTEYRYVELDKALIELGYSYREGTGALRYRQNPNDIPTQLCSPSEYREKIVGSGLVEKNTDDFGIPQGAPISDVLANLFLLEFDKQMKRYVDERGGRYTRYCDDVLILLPGDGRAANGAFKTASNAIQMYDSNLQINPEKTEIVCFNNTELERCYSLVLCGSCGKRYRSQRNDGLSYLGFRYDGENIFLREATLANLRGKIARTTKAAAYHYLSRSRYKSLDWLLANAPVAEVQQRFLKVRKKVGKDYEDESDWESKSKLTFYSYSKRAQSILGTKGRKIRRQTLNIEEYVELQFKKNIEKAFQYWSQRDFYERQKRAACAPITSSVSPHSTTP